MLNQITELVDASFFETSQVLLNLLGALILGLAIAWVYRRTHQGLSYSQGFVLSLVFVSVIACGAIMVVGSNIARAFGLVGALSVIRYRTVVKDTRDASFIFLALVAGFACGTASFIIGSFTTAMVLGLALLAHHFRLGALNEHDFILSFTLARGVGAADRAHVAVLAQYCQRRELLHVETSSDGDLLLLTFDISLKEGVESTDLMRALAQMPHIGAPRLIFAKGDPNV